MHARAIVGGNMDIKTYQRLGLHKPFGDNDFFGQVVNEHSNSEIGDAMDVPGDKQYHPCPEAYPDETVPIGKVTSFPHWTTSQVYPRTRRDIWVYTPYQLDPQGDTPALMIFNDGEMYLDVNGPVRATKVLDSLIHSGDIPIAIAIFIMPGRPYEVPIETAYWDEPKAVRQRSIEYDSCTDRYGRFLLEDVLPFVEGHVECKMTKDPKRRIISGVSSGGICAFNVAWHYPKAFGCVLSHCGSFTNIRGGHNFPYLIRSTERKPIRVFLQSGKADANIVSGNWPLANQQMAAALTYVDYDMQFAFGQGGHSLHQGGAIFADSLRWLWRE